MGDGGDVVQEVSTLDVDFFWAFLELVLTLCDRPNAWIGSS